MSRELPKLVRYGTLSGSRYRVKRLWPLPKTKTRSAKLKVRSDFIAESKIHWDLEALETAGFPLVNERVEGRALADGG